MADSKRTSASSFNELEEDFFRAGAAQAEPEPVETFPELDEGYRPRPLWRRLFARRSTQQ